MTRTRPNILLFVADQHRFDALGCYGNADVQTPHLDALAAAGALFETCYVQNPICGPSRASFATGQYARNHGLFANGVGLPAERRMVSKALADSGYDCGMAGKQHLDACEFVDEPRRDDGYRVYKWSHDPIHQSPHNAYHLWLRDNFPDIYEREIASLAGRPVEAGNVAKGATSIDVLPQEAHYTHWVAQEAIDFLRDHREQAADQPFYFMANFFDPHHPFGAPAAFRDLYDADALAGPVGSRDELADKPGVQREYSDSSYGGHAPGFVEYSEGELREARANYYAMISLIDAEVGRVLDALEQLGERENTIVIYTSDHGELLGDHAIMLKGPMLYEPLVRVPLIVAGAGVEPEGARIEPIVQSIDLTATLLDVAGDDSLPVQGSSLLPLLGGQVVPWRAWALCEYRDSGHAATPPVYTTMLRHGDHKLVVWHGDPATPRDRDGELYDLRDDPHELHNLYGDAASRTLRERMKDELLDVWAATEMRAQPRTGQW